LSDEDIARIIRASVVDQAPGEPLPWTALSQMLLLGCRHPDGSYYRTYPDVFVYLMQVDVQRGSLNIGIDGPPALIIEVLSESTFEVDIDHARGKGYSYARAGVSEYLALDPTGQDVAGAAAWRLAGDPLIAPVRKELASLTDPKQIMPALAQVFGLQEVSFAPLESLVMDYLRDKKLLLILDNCEHLIAACAQLMDGLLHHNAGLKVLASSREALGIAGEMAYRIPSLADTESTCLFEERARAANLRHGYYSKINDEALTALGENPQELADLMAGAHEQWRPANPHQVWITERLARLQWKIDRADRMQENAMARPVQRAEKRRREKAHSISGERPAQETGHKSEAREHEGHGRAARARFVDLPRVVCLG